MDKAGVAAEDYANLVPQSRHKGSAAILSFSSHELLQKVRRQVDALQASFDENDATRKVWLDAKKERSETRPARLVHRDFEAIQTTRADKAAVVKDMRGKRLLVDTKRMGHTLRGVWEWSAAAKQRYGADALQGATAFVQA